MFSLKRIALKNSFILLLLSVFIVSIFPVAAIGDTRVEIFGYVRDDDTGNPIYNAKIDFFYENESIPFISTYSDSSGRIAATVFASKIIKRVEISRTGYQKESFSISTYSSSISLGTKYLKPGSSATNGNYRVYGTVLDNRDGSYISDARILLIDEYEDTTYVGYSNSRGAFDVINLPLGDYQVKISKYGYKDYERSTLLRLRTGDYDNGTVRLESTTSGSSSTSEKKLTGRVTDEDGYYVQNAEVYVINQEDKEIKINTDSRGYYAFSKVETGTYTIGVKATGYELLERINYVRILSTDIEKEINLVIRKESRSGYDVYGRVVNKDKEYIEGVEVSLIDGNTRIKRTTTDSRGYYEIKYVPNGRYTIEFKKLGYTTRSLTDEVRINGSYYSLSQVELEERQGISSVVGGLVGDSQSGLRGVTVTLENSSDSYTATTNYYGYFTFNEVREGTYDLYGRINNQKKLLETGLRISGTRIEVGDINVNRIDSGYTLSGNIKDSIGNNLSNVAVKLSASGINKETSTNSSGNYTISGLERGSYAIVVSKDGYGSKTEEFSVTSYDLAKDFSLKANDYVKVVSTEIKIPMNERVDLNKYISKAEIYSAKNILLDTITSRYEIKVPSEYSSFITAYSNNQITGNKVGTAYIDISITNSRDYDNLSPARVKVTITEPIAMTKIAILTIGSNYYVLDGKTEISDATPYIKSDRSFFPIRVIAKALGVTDANIKWDSITNTAILTKGSDKVEFSVGKDYYKQNGVTLYMDVKPENVNGRVYLPARYVSDALGGEIEWNNFTKSLTITSK